MLELFLGLVSLAVILYGAGAMLAATGHRSADRWAWLAFWLGTFCLGVATITAIIANAP